jgi:hypothetical protein
VTNYPLRALADGVDGGNGVLVQTNNSAFPNVTFNSANYWADVVFVGSLGPDTNAPVVSAVSPTNNATGVSIGTTVTVTFSEAMNPATINTNTITLSNSTGGLVLATVAYNGATNTAVLTPNSPLALSTSYTVRVVGVQDLASNTLASAFISFFTTQAPDTTPPVVSAVSPTNNATGVSIGTTVTVTFSEAMNPATVTNGAITLSNASGGLVASTVAYSGLTAVLMPSAVLALSNTYTVTVKGGVGGVADVATNYLAADFTSSFTTADHASIWDNSATPTIPADTDPLPYELGVKFRSDISGYVTGIRFYKGTGNGGTHIGNLWTVAGTNLATATFTGESASGWQQVNFTTPVAITSNTTYMASYFAPQGHYAIDTGYFATAGVTNYPLRALADGVDGGNGVYVQTNSSAFPNQSFSSDNYWVDVVVTEVSNTIQISSIALSNSVVMVTWTSIAGKSYRLQYKESLTDASWTDLPPDVNATGTTATGTNAVNAASARFYRVKWLGY